MKFISKNSNYGVVLKHGMQAEPMTGRAAVPGLYARFSGGIFETSDEEMIKLLKAHQGFNNDYISGEEDVKDPFDRSEMEPEHDLMDIEHGSVAGNKNPKPKLILNKEQKKLLAELAKGMATEMAVDMVKEMVGKKNVENSKAPEDTDKVDSEVKEDPTKSSEPVTDELTKVTSETEEDDIKPVLTKEETTKKSETKK